MKHWTGLDPREKARLPQLESGGFSMLLVRHALLVSLGLAAALAIAAVVAVEKVFLSPTISASGILEPADITKVSSLESGVVAKVLVQRGELVRQGQVLAVLDTSVARSAVSEIEAELRAIEADSIRLELELPILEQRTAAVMATARAQFDGAQGRLRMSMADFGLFGDPDSTVELNGPKRLLVLGAPAAELAAARAGLSLAIADSSLTDVRKIDRLRLHETAERTRVRLRSANLRLERHSVVSPVAGVVLTARPDRLVGTSVSAGTSLIEVVKPIGWSVVIGMSEVDALRVMTGDRAVIEIPNNSSLSPLRRPGRVALLSWDAPVGGSRANGQLTGFWAQVNLDHEDSPADSSSVLRRGLSVKVKVLTRRVRLREAILGKLREWLI